MTIRPCPVCGVTLTPFDHKTLTAHEFRCYKTKPELVPEYFRAQFESDLAWEIRSNRAKLAAAKRRANQRAKR